MRLPDEGRYAWVIGGVVLFFLIALNSGKGVVTYIFDSPEAILGCLAFVGLLDLAYGWVRNKVNKEDVLI